jgi:hypothetical protein
VTTQNPEVPTEKRDPFPAWYDALERRHLADLTFQEVRRAVQALSVAYVQKRGSHVDRVLETAGKRAAFAMFYAPLHFLTVRAIVRELGAGATGVGEIVDLGCGTGVAGAAWALETGRRTSIVGIERHSWATREAKWTYRKLRVQGRVDCVDLTGVKIDGKGNGIVAAFTINELDRGQRDVVLKRLLEAQSKGAAILVIEPIARRAVPWWNEWFEAFVGSGGRSDQWRFPAGLPSSLKLMDKAAGLDHRELTARSLWLPEK